MGLKVHDPDPVLIGYDGEPWTPKNRSILARWGESLRPYADMLADAKAKVMSSWTESLLLKRSECSLFEERITAHLAEEFSGQWVTKPFSA